MNDKYTWVLAGAAVVMSVDYSITNMQADAYFYKEMDRNLHAIMPPPMVAEITNFSSSATFTSSPFIVNIVPST